jgi:hypothetical protein
MLCSNHERRLFQYLKDREYVHNKVYDAALLNEIVMMGEFGLAFKAIGWSNFWHAWETGLKFLTLKFLTILTSDSRGIAFCLFKEEHTLTWRQVSNALGFGEDCLLEWSRHKGMKNFFREGFWNKISGQGLNPSSNKFDPQLDCVIHPPSPF